MSAGAGTMAAPAAGVKVRMYRQGLGDCFLLAFPTAGPRPFYLLIDCGVLLGTVDAREKMRRVAGSLAEATGGRIDLLVATHQHWDHLSGFDQAREVFDGIEIGEVWAAWTEDPDDPVARRLRARRQATVRALHAAAEGLRAAGDEDTAGSLAAVLGFFGELGADGRPSGIERALAYVLGRGAPPRYRVPGEGPLPLPGVLGVGVYVLGPPRDEALLRHSDPSAAGEVYERLALDADSAFLAAALAAAGDGAAGGEPPADTVDPELRNLAFPFDGPFRIPFPEAQRDPFFQERYYGPAGSEEGFSWRRIDSDWLGSAGQIALQLDGDTNNTSLALAIELSPGGPVLLFPGDAQVGNWESWHGLSWLGRSGPVTVADLLRRTVLYKVGHHASHNATLRARGLELMAHPDLVAMIPVDEAMAHRPKGGNPGGWDMPFGPLLERLSSKARGRVLRADRGIPDRPAGVAEGEWAPFRDGCAETDLYVEITLPAG